MCANQGWEVDLYGILGIQIEEGLEKNLVTHIIQEICKATLTDLLQALPIAVQTSPPTRPLYRLKMSGE